MKQLLNQIMKQLMKQTNETNKVFEIFDHDRRSRGLCPLKQTNETSMKTSSSLRCQIKILGHFLKTQRSKQ